MNKDGVPLIIIHYGDIDYLKVTLKNAVEINTDKRVILIGDDSNAKHTSLGIEHYIFEDYIDSEYLKTFNQHYRIIGGTKFHEINRKKGGKDWTWFNFIKWHVLHEFCKSQNFKQFWTFDSDVLYCKPLSSLEYIYTDFHYTTTGNLFVMQGLVNDMNWLKHFTEQTILTFKDEMSLQLLLETEFVVNPTFGLTMMRLFQMVKTNYNPHTMGLSTIVSGQCYDACICLPFNDEIMHQHKLNNQNVKKVFIDNSGKFLEKNISTGEYFEVFAINMSWVPLYLIQRFSRHIKTRKTYQGNKLYEISLTPPIHLTFINFLKKIPQKIQYEMNKRSKKTTFPPPN